MGKNGAGGRMMNKPKVSKKIGPASQKIGHASQGLKMGRLDLKWDGMLCLFFNNPAKEFQIREISRLIKVPKTTVQRVLKQLVSLKIILVKKKGIFPSYSANETNFWYKFYKKQYFIEEIYASGLIDFLEDFFHPPCIFLFGSGAKGDYIKRSDIDLFLLSPEKEVDIIKYERKLGRKINLLCKERIPDLSPELLNNILNGIKLSGYLKLN